MIENNNRITELATRLKNGDNSAFDELYKLTCSKVYFVALKITKNEHDAEDIIQESYVTALKKIDTLEKPESFMSWLNHIVANKSKSHLRKNSPQFFEDVSYTGTDGTPEEAEEFSPEECADKEELRQCVMEVIDELTEEKRACVMMMYFGDMSVNDISQSLGVPVSTVKNRLWTARKDLKSRFEKRGITAAYSFAPMGLAAWAIENSAEAFSQTFRSGINPSDIISVAAAGTAAAGTAAAGSGIAAKIAALSTVQKIAAGVAVAGVVAGSTVGITSVVHNQKTFEDEVPTTVYTETVESNEVYISETIEENDVYIPEIPSASVSDVNVIDADLQENGEEHENKVIDFKNPGKMPEKIDYKGTLKLGNNHMDFEDGINTYYVTFNADKAGYYHFKCDREDLYKFGWIFVPEDSQSGKIEDFYRAVISTHDNGQLEYFEAGEHTLLISRTEGIGSLNIAVEYFGEEMTDIQIEQEDLDNVILGYNEVTPINSESFLYLAHDMTEVEEGHYGNSFRTKIIFSSGKVYDMGKVGLGYNVKDGKLKEGKNTVTFSLAEFYGFDKEFEITAHPPTDYIKDIEVSNLDELKKVKINEEGFVYEKPESFEVTVTHADGKKETFDGKTWDRFVEISDGRKIFVTFCRARENMSMDYRLRGRESIHFRVSIGETDYVDEICTVTEFDVIGYRKRLDENNLEEAREYTIYIEDGIEQMKENADSAEEFLWYSAQLSKVTAYNSYKIAKRIAGFELDYAITTYKILTENEFELV